MNSDIDPKIMRYFNPSALLPYDVASPLAASLDPMLKLIAKLIIRVDINHPLTIYF